MSAELGELMRALTSRLEALPPPQEEEMMASLRAIMGGEACTQVGGAPLGAAPACSTGDLLVIDEAAALLRVSPRWLYRHAKHLPFARKLSRKVLRFSRAGITRWLATRRP